MDTLSAINGTTGEFKWNISTHDYSASALFFEENGVSIDADGSLIALMTGELNTKILYAFNNFTVNVTRVSSTVTQTPRPPISDLPSKTPSQGSSASPTANLSPLTPSATTTITPSWTPSGREAVSATGTDSLTVTVTPSSTDVPLGARDKLYPAPDNGTAAALGSVFGVIVCGLLTVAAVGQYRASKRGRPLVAGKDSGRLVTADENSVCVSDGTSESPLQIWADTSNRAVSIGGQQDKTAVLALDSVAPHSSIQQHIVMNPLYLVMRKNKRVLAASQPAMWPRGGKQNATTIVNITYNVVSAAAAGPAAVAVPPASGQLVTPVALPEGRAGHADSSTQAEQSASALPAAGAVATPDRRARLQQHEKFALSWQQRDGETDPDDDEGNT